MENISCAAELKLAISEKQFELEVQGQLLKEEFFIAYESLKPVSLIKSTLTEITSSPYLIDNMLGAVMGMLSGYVSKKIAVGTSHNLFRKIKQRRLSRYNRWRYIHPHRYGCVGFKVQCFTLVGIDSLCGNGGGAHNTNSSHAAF